jgi:hypothetical protein
MSILSVILYNNWHFLWNNGIFNYKAINKKWNISCNFGIGWIYFYVIYTFFWRMDFLICGYK